jgi:plastocyanin
MTRRSERHGAARFALQALLAAALLSLFAGWAAAATLNFTAADKTGAVMSDAVIYATQVGVPAGADAGGAAEAVTIAQDHLQFSPYVTAVRVGTPIRFPNYDKIEHHVKSFSPAKEFEIKVYDSGTPPPVLFDKPGVVVVYCLLHEWMRAYVLVLETPHFAKTDASGSASLAGLKEGTWEIRAWHPDMGTIKPPLLQTVKVQDKAAPAPVQFNFDFVPRKRRAAKQ